MVSCTPGSSLHSLRIGENKSYFISFFSSDGCPMTLWSLGLMSGRRNIKGRMKCFQLIPSYHSLTSSLGSIYPQGTFYRGTHLMGNTDCVVLISQRMSSWVLGLAMEISLQEPTELDRFSFFLYVLLSVSLGKFAKARLVSCNCSIIYILKITLDRRPMFRPVPTSQQFVVLSSLQSPWS